MRWTSPYVAGEVIDRMPKARENMGMGHLRGISDDMVGQIRDGTWEALAGPARLNMPLERSRRRALS